MSNYERNNTMVACILAFLIVGSVAIGAVMLLGNTSWNLNPSHWSNPDWNNTTEFTFDRIETTMPSTVTLEITIDVGAVSVEFDDNSTLLYRIDIDVPNPTIEEIGNPTVSYVANKISLVYQVAAVNVTLGNSTSYTIGIGVDTGGISIVIDANAIVGDIGLSTTTGGIYLSMSDTATITNSATFSMTTVTGGVDVSVDLMPGIGGSFTGSTSIGSVDVTDVGWDEVGENHYETPNYDTASQTLTITADVITGGIDATLT